MSNIIKNHKVGIFAIFVAAALVASVATFGDNMAFASNHGEQAILQAQPGSQDSQCVAAGSTSPNGNGNGFDLDEFSGVIASCNNVGLQFQNNDGNLALGQQ